jgi:hypothetical protein
MQMYVESKLKAAINDSFHFMFIPTHWSCFANPDGDKTIVTDSSIITHQQMHQYYLLFKIGFNP